MTNLSLEQKERLKALAVWGGLCSVICGLLYSGSNSYAETASHHYHVYFEFEKSIPQIPCMIVFYISYYLYLLLNFVLVKNPNKIKAICLAMTFSALVAAVVFVVFPSELGFSRAENIDGFEGIFNWLHVVDKPHNLFPSLHITFTTIATFVMISVTQSRLFHASIIAWAVMITFSVVLVHQHHLIDVLTGGILGWVAIRFVYQRFAKQG
jgi:membrane-associated phospholipid phosphatase|tara:strand:+ start:77 stop:706 length:630 start_codon:yes stop_codon:yes gene_type:complete